MKPKTKRNQEIYAARLSGTKYKDLALKYNITIERVRQIVAGEKMNIKKQEE